MKSYKVVLHPRAEEDLNEAYSWSAIHAGPAIESWLSRFEAELQSLSSAPDRFPLARENGRSPMELRETRFGKRGVSVYRIIFTIEPADRVVILRIRRGARRWLSKRDLDELQ